MSKQRPTSLSEDVIPTDTSIVDFNGHHGRFSLFVECLRLTRGYEFNPAFAAEISRIDPLPHQRVAVYDQMLQQDPLRFLLADDAGAGKTIMTGLYIREMLMRERIRRVLVIPPAGLVGNWMRELRDLFSLYFQIVSGAKLKTHNQFEGSSGDLAIVSLDTIRGRTALAALARPETEPYDLVVFDEAHKLSATSEGGRVRKTHRYKLAEALAGCPKAEEYEPLRWSARHLLLLTATPHMGKDSPYHHLWRLLDHRVFGSEKAFQRNSRIDRSSHFARRTKEEMIDFSGRPIFRERRCDTFDYDLTSGPDGERALYERTTSYLRNCYNSATENRAAAQLIVGVFQRRLASSTYALLKSFDRRVAKLRQLTKDLEAGQPEFTGLRVSSSLGQSTDYFDRHDASEDLDADLQRERNEDYENEVLGSAIAATLDEIRDEIVTLDGLRDLAQRIIDSRLESKFEKLREVLADSKHAVEKWLIFSEHRDTVDYLVQRLEGLGYGDRVASIHGGMAWNEREEQVERFRDPAGARFLVATDAAGEGINLQFCRLMINYDIPWNPARLEQRMGRIHRYGQKLDVLILNLVSTHTREGRVLTVLLERMEAIREELQSDKVFDVIGQLFQNQSLREHMRNALDQGGERRATNRIRTVMQAGAIKQIDAHEEKHYGTRSDLVRRLSTLRGEVECERYLHLLPAYVRRFVEMAAPQLDLEVRGHLDNYFSLVPRLSKSRIATKLDEYPPAVRQRLRVRRPARGQLCVWLHPGEPVFDSMCEEVLRECRLDAARGAIFVDPRTESPYLLHLGEVNAKEQGDDANHFPPRTVARNLLAIRQNESGAISAASLDRLAFLQGAPHIPPGAVPLARRASQILGGAAEHFVRESTRLADKRSSKIAAEVAKRRGQIGIDCNLRLADLAKQRSALSKDPQADPQEKQEVIDLQQHIEARRQLELQRLDAMTKRIVPGPLRLFAHALVLPSINDTERDAFDADVERIAMAIAAEWERNRGATVRDVSTPRLARAAGLGDYPGFDLLAASPGGTKRHIEVKGRAGRGDVRMESNEYRAACNLGMDYWLYVVLNCTTPTPELVRVRDPFDKLIARAETRLRISLSEVMRAAAEDESVRS